MGKERERYLSSLSIQMLCATTPELMIVWGNGEEPGSQNVTFLATSGRTGISLWHLLNCL